MENTFFEVVISEMQPFFDENGFKAKDGIFANDTKAVKVEYDEGASLYKLFVADVTDGAVGDYALSSSYLFDEKSIKTDAVAVGIDFVDTLKSNLGIKAVRTKAAASELPTASASGKVNADTLTAKLLANYPDLKETYKAYVGEKGKYLPLDFGATYFVPEIRKTLDQNNKKQVKKLLDMFADIFVAGDRASVNLSIAFLSAAIGKSADRFKTVADRLDDCPLLVAAVNQEIAELAKNKKLQKALKFEE